LTLTPQQVLSFAPDNTTARRGEDLATTRKWRNLEGDTQYLWGECKGSGADYYKTQLSLKGPAFKCNCPSRKFPCKHSIALLLIYAEQSEAFRVTEDYPEWVREWMISRGVRVETNESADAAQQAQAQQKETQKLKNKDARIALMASGVEDLEQWLQDLLRQGLAATEGQNYNYWQSIASRMVDAKLGGVARRIRQFPLIHNASTDWPERMLMELSQLYLIVKGFENLDDLPTPLQRELLTVAGLNIKSADVLTQKGLTDDWLVMGLMEGVEENLNFRHTWLYGAHTEEIALLLEYSFGDQGYPHTWRAGQAFNGEIVFYPSAFPLRAIVKQQKGTVAMFEEPRGYHTLERFFEHYTKALAQNPWVFYFPCYLESVIPTMEDGRLYIIDEEKKYIEALPKDQMAWKLIALSGGGPISIFGEWTGEFFLPLSVMEAGNIIAL
jgi:hypothetical protein